MKILNRWDSSLLFESEEKTLKEVVEEDVKQGVNLRGVNLRGADLYGAKGIKSFQCGEYNRVSFALKHKDVIMFKIGCFWGNTEEAINEVREKYGADSDYEKLINLYTEMLINNR